MAHPHPAPGGGGKMMIPTWIWLAAMPVLVVALFIAFFYHG